MNYPRGLWLRMCSEPSKPYDPHVFSCLA